MIQSIPLKKLAASPNNVRKSSDPAADAQPPGRQAVTQVHVPVMMTGQSGTMITRSRYLPSADASGQ